VVRCFYLGISAVPDRIAYLGETVGALPADSDFEVIEGVSFHIKQSFSQFGSPWAISGNFFSQFAGSTLTAYQPNRLNTIQIMKIMQFCTLFAKAMGKYNGNFKELE